MQRPKVILEKLISLATVASARVAFTLDTFPKSNPCLRNFMFKHLTHMRTLKEKKVLFCQYVRGEKFLKVYGVAR